MTLVAPQHILRPLAPSGRATDRTRERDAWIVEQRNAGFSPDQIAKALGLGRCVVWRVVREALIRTGEGTRPPGPPPSVGDDMPPPRIEGKQVYLLPGETKINLPCPIGQEGELAIDPRTETKPRGSYMIAVPDGRPRHQSPRILGVIAAIREMHAQSGQQ